MQATIAPPVSTPTRAIRLSIIDDDQPLRKAIQNYFKGHPTIHCKETFGEVGTFIETMRKNKTSTDVVILDISRPAIESLKGIGELRRFDPRIKVVVYSIFEDSDRIFKALRAGASGYLQKEALMSELIEAVQDVHEGHAAMSPSIARKVINYCPRSRKVQLSFVEHQVVTCLAKGLSHKKIGMRLGIAHSDVNRHVRHVYGKLQLQAM